MKIRNSAGLFARVTRHFCTILGLAFVLTIVLTMTTWSEDAHALIACRGDPVVTLSDGSIVHLTATFTIDGSNVKHVQYTLHAPQGTSVVNVIYTGGALNGKESFVFFADQSKHHYQVVTYADTATASSVNAMISVVIPGSVSNQSASVTGTNNQNILTQVSW